MILTEQLLQTGMFIANAQLDAYIKLINSSDSTVKYGEKHHIIPRSYYKLTGQKIDNSKANVVKLSYFEHILAHYSQHYYHHYPYSWLCLDMLDKRM